MNIETITQEVRDLLCQYVTKIKANTALGLTDLNRYSERFLLDLLRELYVMPGLRSLNQERMNFPGLDLGDDETGRAFQITATADLSKVKSTLQTVIKGGLHKRFTRVQVFILAEKQTTYSKSALDQIVGDELKFDAAVDIIDYRDVLRICAGLELAHLARVRDVLKRHLTAPATGAFQMPQAITVPTGAESVELNMVPIWFPAKMFLASFIAPSAPQHAGKRSRRKRFVNPRSDVARDILSRGFEVPEDFEIHAEQIVTFRDLSERVPALEPYFDAGTVTDISPSEFFSLDDAHLYAFKSLLRRCVQRQLRDVHVQWQHDEHLFFFGPERDEIERRIAWTGMKAAERVVYKRTMKNNKPEEILTCKHLAFRLEFHLFDANWYISITPTWYFSRDGYRVDRFGAKNISWLKRQENNQQVHTHFRFIVHQLHEVQENSLFDTKKVVAHIQVGEPVSFQNHPVLPDDLWNPQGLRKPPSEEDTQTALVL